MLNLSKAGFLFTPLLIGSVGIHEVRQQPGYRPAAYEMTQESTIAIKPGTWGGTGLSFVVKKDAVEVEFDCATATIAHRLTADRTGKFTADGSLEREGPGPTRMDATPTKQKVRFTGAVHGKQMRLKVSFVDTGESIGSFTVELDKQPRLRKCR